MTQKTLEYEVFGLVDVQANGQVYEDSEIAGSYTWTSKMPKTMDLNLPTFLFLGCWALFWALLRSRQLQIRNCKVSAVCSQLHGPWWPQRSSHLDEKRESMVNTFSLTWHVFLDATGRGRLLVEISGHYHVGYGEFF